MKGLEHGWAHLLGVGLGLAGACNPLAAQCFVQEVRAPVPYDYEVFGASVSVRNGVAIVGEPSDSTQGNESGAAAIFRRGPRSWIMEASLLASDGHSNLFFGAGVAIEGDRAVVGAYGDHDAVPGTGVGSLYVFAFDGTNWVEETELYPADTTPKLLGWSVAMDGETVMAGARTDDESAENAGAAYIFRHDGSTWVQEAKLRASDAGAGDELGWSVAIDGDVAVVGANKDDNQNGTNAGAAYVFRFDGSRWVEEARLVASMGLAEDWFGKAVAIDGDVVAVGAPRNFAPPGSGAAYVYRFDGATWVEESRLEASDQSTFPDRFGESVAVEGSSLAVGAYWTADCFVDDRSGWWTGSVYRYGHDGRRWVEQSKLLAPGGREEDLFGRSVALSGDVLLVGAWGDSGPGEDVDGGSGAAYFFEGEGCEDVGFCAPAEAVLFNDQAQWMGAVGEVTTITFCELPHFALVTDQYEELGVLFRGGVGDLVVHGCGTSWCPNDDCGVNGFDWTELIFTTPQRWIALEHPHDMSFIQISAQGVPIFTSEFDGIGNGVFSGLLVARPFDRVFISDEPGQVSFDDLHFGASMTGDVNFDQRVDVQDLAGVILGWGLCVGPPPAICLADLDFDGTVNVQDLYVVIENWSPE